MSHGRVDEKEAESDINRILIAGPRVTEVLITERSAGWFAYNKLRYEKERERERRGTATETSALIIPRRVIALSVANSETVRACVTAVIVVAVDDIAL